MKDFFLPGYHLVRAFIRWLQGLPNTKRELRSGWICDAQDCPCGWGTYCTHIVSESANELSRISVVLFAWRDKLSRQSEGCAIEEFCYRAAVEGLRGHPTVRSKCTEKPVQLLQQ